MNPTNAERAPRRAFVSYSSHDAEDARAVAAALETQGVACWIAPRDVPPGSRYGEAIIDGINACTLFVLLLSEHSNASPQVLAEVERAVSKGLSVFTLRMEAVALTKSLEYFLSAFHWIDAFPPLAQNLTRLVEAINQRGAGAETHRGEAGPVQEPAPVRRDNLPHQPTSFIGREKELGEITSLLLKSRLLTLTGVGGSGKTRLSLQAAAEFLEHFHDGVFLVELAPLADPALVVQTTANVLGIREVAGQPLLVTLTEHLKAKNLLLILDNCEHVLDAGAALADALLRTCSDFKILATSREGLGIAWETTYRVPALSLPSPKGVQTAESLSQYDAVQLFIDRAVQTRPDFAVTNANAPALASICFRLDGIPLAIELAAARARSLSVEDINAKLDQRFRLLTGGSRTALPRQQTLRSLIDWSYDLLVPAEKALLRSLSVFAGGWVLEAAEAVCNGTDVEDWEILDHLTSLCDKSLVVAEPSGATTRYRMLETVRQYAHDRLLESGEGEEFRDKHLAFFLALAEELEPRIDSPGMTAMLDRMEEEIDNFRAAQEWGVDAPERAETGLRLALAVTNFLRARGYFTERRERLSRAVECAVEVNPSLRAKGLYALGAYALTFLDFETARRSLEESLVIRQALEERPGIAKTLDSLGWLATLQKEYALARHLSEECLRIQRELENQEGIASALNNLGNIAYYQDDPASARSFFEESLKLYREIGSPFYIYVALTNLGRIDQDAKDYHAAGMAWRECLAIVVGHKLKGAIPWALNALAGLIAVTDTPLDAARLWGAAQRLYEEGSEPMFNQVREMLDENIAAARVALDNDAAFDAVWQEGRHLTLEQAVALAQREHASPSTDLSAAG